MLALISPAKKLDLTPVGDDLPVTRPDFLDETVILHGLLKALPEEGLMRLMKLSPKLAALNADRFRAFKTPFTSTNAKPAGLMFKGDTYTGLDAETFEAADWVFAQEHLRILSGFYGLLRPLDLMQPYRLEMGTRLANARGRNLYEFWEDRLADGINALGEGTLVNLASNEYFKAVDRKSLAPRVITPVFMEIKNGTPKVIGLMAKRARGAMARFIIKERLTRPEPLQSFTEGGYAYRPEHSDDLRWVFTREA